jgi:hypothetical protein
MAAASVPACALGALSALALALAVVDSHPMWPEQSFNLSEAAALRDAAQVVWLIGHGEDPGTRRPVRAGYLRSYAVAVTPLEAAIAARRAEVVFIVLHYGAPLDPPEWNRVRCLAAIARDPDVARLLDQRRPIGATTPDCAGVTVPWERPF